MGKIFNDVVFVVTKNGKDLAPKSSLGMASSDSRRDLFPENFKRFKDAEKFAKTQGDGCKIEMRGLIYNNKDDYADTDSIVLKKNVKKQCEDSNIGFEVIGKVGCEFITIPGEGAPFSTYKKAKKRLKEEIKDFKKHRPDNEEKWYISLQDDSDGYETTLKENVSSIKKALKKQKDRDDDYER